MQSQHPIAHASCYDILIAVPANRTNRRVLVTLPPPLDELVEAAAEQIGVTIPAYLTALAATAHHVAPSEPLRRGKSRNPEKSPS